MPEFPAAKEQRGQQTRPEPLPSPILPAADQHGACQAHQEPEEQPVGTPQAPPAAETNPDGIDAPQQQQSDSDLQQGDAGSEAGSGDASRAAPQGGYDEPGQGMGILLRMETVSASETRKLVGTLEVVVQLSLALLVVLLVFKWRSINGQDPFCTETMNLVNLAFSALELGVLLGVALWCIYTFIRAFSSGQPVSKRRWKVMVSHLVQLAVTLTGIALYFAANAVAVATVSCTSPVTQRAIGWMSFVRFTCWNTLFLVFTVRAHNTCILLPKVDEAAMAATAAAAAAAAGGAPGLPTTGLDSGSHGSSSSSSGSSSNSDSSSSSSTEEAADSPDSPFGNRFPSHPIPRMHAKSAPVLAGSTGKSDADLRAQLDEIQEATGEGGGAADAAPSSTADTSGAAAASTAGDAGAGAGKPQEAKHGLFSWRQRRKRTKRSKLPGLQLADPGLLRTSRVSGIVGVGAAAAEGIAGVGTAAADVGSAAVDAAVGGTLLARPLARLRDSMRQRERRYEAAVEQKEEKEEQQQQQQQQWQQQEQEYEQQQDNQQRSRQQHGQPQQEQQEQQGRHHQHRQRPLPRQRSKRRQQTEQRQQEAQKLEAATASSKFPGPTAEADLMVVDLPWRFHWPKLVPWLLLEGCELTLTILLMQEVTNTGTCSLNASCTPQRCAFSSASLGLTATSIALVAQWYAIFVALMWRSRSLLRKRPWQMHRAANAAYRLEARLGLWAYSIIFLALLLFWFVDFGSCSHYSFQYYGTVPTELVWCTITVIGCLLFSPVSTGLRQPVLVSALQDFAWTESSLQDKLQARNAAARGKLDTEPMFCYETAVKLFYWSCLCYDYQEENESWVSPMKENDLGQLLKGMNMYGLNVHRVVEQESLHLKALFAWGPTTVVIAFRGSAAAVNFIADIMVWQVAHPPNRGNWYSRPRVHKGFLKCWSAGNFDKRVLSTASMLISSCLDPQNLKIYLTGHSLGGALATLAAYDIVKAHPNLKPHQISCYTFGCPRAGNRAFAIDYEKAVPDTWHVINDQDIVPRGGKFISLYKRNGQRVIINKHGDLIVRPVPLEASLLQMPFGSNVMHHLLAAYQEALAAVALGQLDALKAVPGGTQGLMELVNESPVVAENMYRYGEKSLILWLGVRVWHTLAFHGPRNRRRQSTATAAAMQLPLAHNAPAAGLTDPSSSSSAATHHHGTAASSGSGRGRHAHDLEAAWSVDAPAAEESDGSQVKAAQESPSLDAVVEHTLRPARSAPHALTIPEGAGHLDALPGFGAPGSSASDCGSRSSSETARSGQQGDGSGGEGAGDAAGAFRRLAHRVIQEHGRMDSSKRGDDDLSREGPALSMGVRRIPFASGLAMPLDDMGVPCPRQQMQQQQQHQQQHQHQHQQQQQQARRGKGGGGRWRRGVRGRGERLDAVQEGAVEQAGEELV